ncbi:uncharacterized protein YpbB [Alkalibacillus flavidus]|uniref:Uncharacterized protein YpbB n=1 Tax=Alkalibacillus flavidus TaxID=546021 RepID=A0ABV2KUT3_9BACI
MTFEEWLLLKLKHIEGERTPRSVYHILRGKKSAQTFQDSQLFSLSPYMNVLPKLKLTTFDEAIDTLCNTGYIDRQSSLVLLTDKGRDFCHQLQEPFVLNGTRYGVLTHPFVSKLHLLVQSVSNLAHNHSQFIPIVNDEDSQKEVKLLFHQKHLLQDQGESLFRELEQLCLSLPSYQADLVLQTFSGYDQIGLSYQQLAERQHKDAVMIELYMMSAFHQWMDVIENEPGQFPICHRLMPAVENVHLTQSAVKTRQLYNKGLTMDAIINHRQLKRSTIEDHIVEIAMKDTTFSIRPFITYDQEQTIRNVLQNETSMRLKRIKDQLTDEITYFHIRLVLAKVGQKEEANIHG